MSRVRSYLARVPEARRLLTGGGFVVLVLLSETYHLSVVRPTLVALLGWSVVGLLLLYLSAAAIAVALSIPLLGKPLAASLPPAIAAYAVISIKSLGIDADFLGSGMQRLAFGVGSAAFFAVAVLVYRKLKTDLAIFVLVLAYVNTLKWLQRGWGARGGDVTAFLSSTGCSCKKLVRPTWKAWTTSKHMSRKCSGSPSFGSVPSD